MIVKTSSHPDQIRWYVESALGSFETLDQVEAMESVRHDLQAILRYLDSFDAADKAVLVSGVEGIKSGVNLELRIRNGDATD